MTWEYDSEATFEDGPFKEKLQNANLSEDEVTLK